MTPSATAPPDELSGPAAEAGGLVCVYYRVDVADLPIAIALVRDFQRILRERFAGLVTEVLVRCEARPAAEIAAVTPGSEATSRATTQAADATLMETYRLPPPAASAARPVRVPPAPPVASGLLLALGTEAAPLAPLLHGPRHVEVFTPCAS